MTTNKATAQVELKDLICKEDIANSDFASALIEEVWLEYQLAALTGHPGTGKTTMMASAVTSVLGKYGLS